MAEASRAADWEDLLVNLYSDAVLEKAEELVRAGDAIERDEMYDSVYWVQGSQPGSVYRVQVIEESDEDGIPFVMCGCPNGTRLGGRPTCYHSAAVLLGMSER